MNQNCENSRINNESAEPLVRIKNLKKYFKIPNKGVLHAVDDVSFDIYPHETLGIVGESGCGKSTIGNVVMRLLPQTDGVVEYRGQNLFDIRTREEKLEICKKMQIIFQDPYSSLNPRKIIRDILAEGYQIHHYGDAQTIERLVKELCDMVEIPLNLLDHYPHELDGGMRQVVGIARALSLNPDFIVCDEPVSSLDVSIQAKIINMLIDLQKKKNLSYMFISHDLSVVRHISHRIAVMYLGKAVETADSETIFRNTMHPYSIALLSAVPQINTEKKVNRILLKGDVPSPINPKPGCRFAPRCWMACERCFQEEPQLTEVEPGHCVACHYWKESREKAKNAAKISMNQI